MQENETKRFKRFNDGFAYLLGNIFRFIWTIFKFFIRISSVVVITFPFVLFGMCIVAPQSAIATLEALAQFIQTIINFF